MAYCLSRTLKLKTSLYPKFRWLHVSSSSQKLVQFILSDIGEGIREVTIRDWFVQPGTQVAQFDNICLVESDKASVNITSRYDGIIKKLHYNVGDIALVGKPLIDIDTENVENITDDTETEIFEKKLSEVDDDISQDIFNNKSLATPSVRRIAREHNISLSEVKGTGKSGRILKEDILNHLNVVSESSPEILTSSKSESSSKEKVIPITGIKKAMVNTMTISGNIPTFCYCDEVIMNNLIDLRNEVKEEVKKNGIDLTFMPFFVKALSKCLEKYPELNASVDNKCENIIVKSNHNIGVAMDTKLGLLVPNIKQTQNLNIIQIAIELKRLLSSGKAGLVSPNDLTGGTFTISNIGIIGGTYTRPLILPPELAIVALGKIQEKPIFSKSGEVVKGYIMAASWAADHRVLDGATVARFASLWKNYIENPTLLTLGV